MTFRVKFSEQGGSFRARFGETHNLSDGGYERGFEEGYEKGYAEGKESIPTQEKAVSLVTNGTTIITADDGYMLKKVTANVDVPSADSLLSGSITAIKCNVASVIAYGCYGRKNLITVDLQRATTIGERAFYSCSNLSTINLPAATTIGSYCFYGCSALKEIKLRLITTISNSSFRNCSKLTKADFDSVNRLESYCFDGCSELKILILRSSNVATLAGGTTSLSGTPISKNTANDVGGHIYVRGNLLSIYQQETNWSYYKERFRVLEEYTVDGTATGAFDESKIGE